MYYCEIKDEFFPADEHEVAAASDENAISYFLAKFGKENLQVVYREDGPNNLVTIYHNPKIKDSKNA